jgi:hypothetical protein
MIIFLDNKKRAPDDLLEFKQKTEARSDKILSFLIDNFSPDMVTLSALHEVFLAMLLAHNLSNNCVKNILDQTWREYLEAIE